MIMVCSSYMISDRAYLTSYIGNLTVRLFEDSPTAYCEPRFVSFSNHGTELLVGHLEQALV